MELKLTPQEMRILSLCIHGYTYGEIAYALQIEESTVNTHMRSIRNKMVLPNCKAMVAPALKMGFDMRGNYEDTYLFEPTAQRTFRKLPWEKKKS